jgi:hypothetical protein
VVEEDLVCRPRKGEGVERVEEAVVVELVFSLSSFCFELVSLSTWRTGCK